MAVKVRRGFEGKLYLGTGSATPTLTVVGNVKDVKVGGALDEVEAWFRSSLHIKSAEPTGLAVDVTGKVRVDENDSTGFLAMRSAFLVAGGTELDVIVLNGTSTDTGVVGLRFGAKLFEFPTDQANTNIQDHDFKLKPCISTQKFQSVSVVNSAPVYTDLN